MVKGPVVGIVGLGLVGGSLARALSRSGYRVVGLDREPVKRQARAAGAVASTTSSLDGLAEQADVVVLAATPKANLSLLRRLPGRLRPGAVVTDVGSVKGPICREAARLGLSRFVGGHPVAGTEGSGFAASSADLFRDRSWILCPGQAAPAALRVVSSLVRAVGAHPVRLDPSEHDRTLAFLSHAPQLVSWALFEAAQGDPVTRRHLNLAGPGFRDMTRLARSPRGLWREILAQNQPEVRRAVASVSARLAAARRR
jgi:prephenate dehydrogenase